MEKGISVIICCYNSATRLPQTLEHIAKQNVPEEFSWEVIVINNNSNDNTVDVAKSEWSRQQTFVPFVVIDEPKPGLSNARKTGILRAKYKYTIFCDDDNWLNSDYVKVAFEVIDHNPEIGMLGGCCDAVCEISVPDWFEEKKFAYAIGKQGEQSGDITQRGYMWGAGVVLKTNVLKSIYNHNINSLLMGREGKTLNAGDDAEISCWFLMLGYKFWYDERLYFNHFIAKERLTVDYMKRLFEGFDRTTPIMTSYYRIIDFQRDFVGRKYPEIFIKALYKLFLIKLNILPFKQNLPRLKENIQISSNSKIVYNKNIALVQHKIFNRLLKLEVKR